LWCCVCLQHCLWKRCMSVGFQYSSPLKQLQYTSYEFLWMNERMRWAEVFCVHQLVSWRRWICGLKEGKRVKLNKQIKFDVVPIHVAFLPDCPCIASRQKSVQNKIRVQY
jgi:hypothetical protein